MVDEKKVATSNAIEFKNTAVAENIEQVNEQPCCPKSKTTVIAVIDGNIVELSTSLYFGEDVTLGDIDTPFALTVGNTTDIEKMLAHGKYNRMQVVDLNGRIFYAGNVADFDENDLNDGQYIFEFFTTDGQAVCYKRLIRRFAE